MTAHLTRAYRMEGHLMVFRPEPPAAIHKSIIHRAGDLFMDQADSQPRENAPATPQVPPQWSAEFHECWKALRERFVQLLARVKAAGEVA